MPTLHIGKHRVETLTATDGSTIPAGAVTVTGGGAYMTTSVDPATNNVTVTGVAAGNGNVTYSAPGYQSVTESFSVVALPTLIVTDGPEQ